MKTKLAIFDLDGTLYDTRMTNYLSYRDALRQYNLELDYDYFSKYCNGRHYTEFLPQIMGNSNHINCVHTAKKEKYMFYLEMSIENQHLFNIISSIKDEYYIAIVTTASRKNCEEILSYHGRMSSFDLIISQEDVKNRKPDPEGFQKAMDFFKVQCRNSIIFEDSDVGIEAALRSGATVFIVKGFA